MMSKKVEAGAGATSRMLYKSGRDARNQKMSKSDEATADVETQETMDPTGRSVVKVTDGT